MSRKPPGYWQDFDHVQTELTPFIMKYGRLPTNCELASEGFSTLARVIPKYHGGFAEVARQLGTQTYEDSVGKKHKNTWNEENVIDEFLRYVRQEGIDYFPTRRELLQDNSSLWSGITQVFGTYAPFKNELKKRGIFLRTRPRKGIHSWDNTVAILSPIVEEEGHLPSDNDLDRMGLTGLRGYISTHKLRRRLLKYFGVTSKPRKYTVPRKTGYWNEKSNLLKELDQVFETYGRIPTDDELRKLGFGSLPKHMRNLDEETLKQYGYSKVSFLLRARDGHYLRSTYELLFDNFLSHNGIEHLTEGLITENGPKKYLYDFKIRLRGRPLFVEIWGYGRSRDERERTYQRKRAKKEELYRALQLELIGIESSLFNNSFLKMYEDMATLLQRYDSEFRPRPCDLSCFVWGSHHNIGDVSERLQAIIDQNDGYFPTTDEIRKEEGGEGLLSMIMKFGGVSVFKKILGTDLRPRETMWSLKHLRGELMKINNLRYIPSYTQLEVVDRTFSAGYRRTVDLTKSRSCSVCPQEEHICRNTRYRQKANGRRNTCEVNLRRFFVSLVGFHVNANLAR